MLHRPGRRRLTITRVYLTSTATDHWWQSAWGQCERVTCDRWPACAWDTGEGSVPSEAGGSEAGELRGKVFILICRLWSRAAVAHNIDVACLLLSCEGQACWGGGDTVVVFHICMTAFTVCKGPIQYCTIVRTSTYPTFTPFSRPPTRLLNLQGWG